MTLRIGRYEVLETLGKGGMGVVYRARDPELDRDVAIKLVLSWAQYDADAMARFNREARVVAQLQHPHIVTIFDAGRTEEDLPYFVMEFLEGSDLGEVLGLAGTLSSARTVRYALQVCDGLEYAHAREIVHRDIKPANLFITPDDQLKIVDFGIARLVGSQITGTGMSLGTPLYMAPEQVAGQKVDRRADIFALGGVMFAMLAGRSPFEAPTLGGICHKIETHHPPPLAEYGAEAPPGLEAIIRRALEKDPEKRYQNAAELAKHLHGVEEGLDAAYAGPTVITPATAPASPGTLTEPMRPQHRRPQRTIALVAIAVIAAVAALWAVPGSPLRPISSQLPERETEALPEEAPPADESVADAGDAGEDTSVETASESSAGSESPSSGAAGSAGDGAASAGSRSEAGTGASVGADETPTTDVVEESGRVDAGEPGDAPGGGATPTLYPAAPTERATVNRITAALMRAIEAKDSAAIVRAFGGRMPAGQWRLFDRLLEGPRLRIRHEMGNVGSADNGVVVAEVHADILFLGQPGRTPAPRKLTWVMRFRTDKTGLYLTGLRPR
jgi:serine/threonine-protein kinase